MNETFAILALTFAVMYTSQTAVVLWRFDRIRRGSIISNNKKPLGVVIGWAHVYYILTITFTILAVAS